MDVNVSFRGQSYQLSLLPETTLEALQIQLEELTSVPPSLQKLLYRGKKPALSSDATVVDAGIKNGMKIQLVGSTEKEMDNMRSAEDEKRKKDEILARRAGMKFPKARRDVTR